MEKDYVIITGGAGFIGSYMAKWYCENNFGVVVIDNLFRGSLNRTEQYTGVAPSSGTNADPPDVATLVTFSPPIDQM